jgi:hypothetical protein
MSGSQSVTLKAAGLNTLNNPFSSVLEGSLAEAINVNIDRNNVLEPRRGMFQYGTLFGDGNDRVKQIFNYKDVILRHVLSKIQFDSDAAGSFVDFQGQDTNEVQEGLRIKGIEANGNFYYTTATGIKKLSAATSADFPTISIQDAGGPKGLDVQATPNYTNNGFLEANSKVAYRIVWGYKDNNNNLILGSPSARTVVYNVSTTNSCFVDLKFSVPREIQSTDYFYQVYRTGITTGDLPPVVTTPQEPADPGDEMNLVFEENITSAEITSGIISVVDITPEDFRKNGTLLYTNPTSGDGIGQANEKPPFAKDVCLYKGYTFYANTSTVQRLNFSFLSVVDFVTNVTQFRVNSGATTNVYKFQGSMETYTIEFGTSAVADFYNSVAGTAKYFTLQSANNAVNYCVYWVKDITKDLAPSLPGYLNVKVDISAAGSLSVLMDDTASAIMLATNEFNITKSGTKLITACANNGYVTNTPTQTVSNGKFAISKNGLGTGEDAANKKIFLPRIPTGTENGPTVSQQLEQVATSLVRVLNLEDNIVYAYYQSDYGDVPGAVLLEQQDTTGPQFYITSDQGQEFTPSLPNSGTLVSSTNEISPNRVMWSKFQQPEAVPLANYQDVGPRDREIKRIIALRDSLFIFKEDGIYRLSGDTAPFTIAPFDFSTQVLAPDTAVVLNNQIYALSTQGVCVVTDTGVQIISRPIENQLLKIARLPYHFKTASFGVSYETDRSYLLYTVTNEDDVVATQVFRYNTFTSCWTKWSMTATCGLVSFADDKLYIGAGDANFTEKERKTLTRADHADRQYSLQVSLNGVNGNQIAVNSVSRVAVGDVVIQQQYLTAQQFNQLLDKLDRDIGVFDDNYLAQLLYIPGQDMRSKLNDLSLKLDADPGVDYAGFNTDIADQTYTLTAVTPSGPYTVLTTSVNHNIKPSRYITIGGTDSTPAISGTHKVISTTNNTLTIAKTITAAGTTGTIQTAINDFRDIQACYNIITYLLNNDTHVFFTNYPTSTGTVDFEVSILGINKNTNSIIVKTGEAFLFGEITLYKAIPSTVIWNPLYFGDPSLTKQVREGTMIFENSNFSKVTIAYGTDMSPGFAPITFEGPGLSVGDWGYFAWGSINWGGVAAPIPLRTYIPLVKQRCRFMNVKFMHNVAFEKYAIYGLSLTYRIISTRGYR